MPKLVHYLEIDYADQAKRRDDLTPACELIDTAPRDRTVIHYVQSTFLP
jgi:hypothetical protein